MELPKIPVQLEEDDSKKVEEIIEKSMVSIEEFNKKMMQFMKTVTNITSTIGISKYIDPILQDFLQEQKDFFLNKFEVQLAKEIDKVVGSKYLGLSAIQKDQLEEIERLVEEAKHNQELESGRAAAVLKELQKGQKTLEEIKANFKSPLQRSSVIKPKDINDKNENSSPPPLPKIESSTNTELSNNTSSVVELLKDIKEELSGISFSLMEGVKHDERESRKSSVENQRKGRGFGFGDKFRQFDIKDLFYKIDPRSLTSRLEGFIMGSVTGFIGKIISMAIGTIPTLLSSAILAPLIYRTLMSLDTSKEISKSDIIAKIMQGLGPIGGGAMGSIIGTLFGGPVGWVIGGILGTALGYISREFNDEELAKAIEGKDMSTIMSKTWESIKKWDEEGSKANAAMVNYVNEIIGNMMKPVTDWFKSQIEEIKDMYSSVDKFMVSSGEKLQSMLKGIFVDSFVNLYNFIENKVTSVKETIGTAIENSMKIVTDKMDAVKSIFDNLIDGIKSFFDKIVDKVTNNSLYKFFSGSNRENISKSMENQQYDILGNPTGGSQIASQFTPLSKPFKVAAIEQVSQMKKDEEKNNQNNLMQAIMSSNKVQNSSTNIVNNQNTNNVVGRVPAVDTRNLLPNLR